MKPRNIGRYQIKAELNRGGMSVVYLAHDPNVGRDVAIKMLPRSLSDQAAARKRFEREVHVVAQLDHPAIVPIYDFGEEDGQPYIVMRYMPGGSLADILTYGRLNLSDAARILERLAQALDVAHAQNIIHRDLKPGNILFDNYGEAFLTDFGIVKIYEAEANAPTLTGSVVLGTPAYMSPEQALGKPLDERSDVYSLGAVLYEMLTGVPPYKGPTSISVAMKHVMEPVPNPREYRPDLPEACIAVVERAMAKDPSARFATAGEMAAAFTKAMTSAPAAEPMMPPLTVRKKTRTTSNAAVLSRPAREPAVTTESVLGETPVQAPSVQRGFAIAVAAVAILFIVGLGVFLFAMVRQAGNAAQLPGSAPPSPTIFATTPVVPLPDQSPTPTEPATEPTDTPTPEPVRLRVIRTANVRQGPSTQFPVLTQLSVGTEVIPISVTEQRDGDWYLIRLLDGRTGYIFSELVRVINPDALPALPTAIVIVPPTVAPPAVTPPLTPMATPTETPSPTPTATATETPTPTVTATATPVPLPTATFTPLVSPTPTETPVITPTATLTVTLTPGP